MEVQPMDKEDAAREKGIYHVTVVGSEIGRASCRERV